MQHQGPDRDRSGRKRTDRDGMLFISGKMGGLSLDPGLPATESHAQPRKRHWWHGRTGWQAIACQRGGVLDGQNHFRDLGKMVVLARPSRVYLYRPVQVQLQGCITA